MTYEKQRLITAMERIGRVLELELIMEVFETGGYWGLFLWLWLGVFGVPVPNEVIVLTLSFAASLGAIDPLTTFLVTYVGILFALNTLYLLGRIMGRRLLGFFQKQKRFSKHIDRSLYFMEKYHAFSLILCYPIPGIRNFVPFLYGSSRLPFKTFALYAYTGVFIWLFSLFSLGYLFADHIDHVAMYGYEIIIVLLVILGFYFISKRKKRPNANKERTGKEG